MLSRWAYLPRFHLIVSLISFVLVGFNKLNWYIHILHYLLKLPSCLQIFNVSDIVLELFMKPILQKCREFIVKQDLVDFVLSFSTVVLVIFAEVDKGCSSDGTLREIVLFFFLFLIIFIIIQVNVIKRNLFSRAIFKCT